MKKLLLLSLIGCTTLAMAQPVMQNVMPIGFSCTMSFGPAAAPGSGGANQTWNLSAVPATPSATMTIVSPGSTPCGSAFPSANWAQSISGANFNYYVSTSSQLEVIGESIPANCSGGMTYTDPKIVLQFPFSFTNSFSDTYNTGTATGSVTTTYDGYGTLITPAGTYTNVARVIFTDGGSTTYEWFDTGAWGHPLAMIVGSSTIFFTNPSVGVAETNVAETARIYPNPAHGNLSVSLAEIPNGAALFNAMGMLVMTISPVSETFKLDVSALPAGIYFLKLDTSKGAAIKKIVVE